MAPSGPHGFLGPPKTAGYAPSVTSFSLARALVEGSRPPFQLADVEWQSMDPQVQMGLRAIAAPLAQIQWTVTSKHAKVAAFVDAQLKKIWTTSLPKLLKCVEYGRMAAEVLYGRESGRVVFDRIADVHPLDAVPLVLNNQLVGVEVRHAGEHGSVRLGPPRSLWVVNDPVYGTHYGRSRLESAWTPWIEKTGRLCALELRRLHFQKNAGRGDVIYYPEGTTDLGTADNPNIVSNHDIAQELVEKISTGGVMTMPGARDEKGNRSWEMTPPVSNNPPGGLLDYVKDLDSEILRAMGVPPEVLQASGDSGSGYAGRAIPAQLFYVSEDQIAATLIHTLDKQVLKFLVRENFGAARYTIEIESLVPKPPPAGGGGPPQPGDSPLTGGGPGRPPRDNNEPHGWQPDPDSQPVRMSLHAPPGYTRAKPLTIGGQSFVGGEFIPSEVMGRATPQERAAVLAGKPGAGQAGPSPSPQPAAPKHPPEQLAFMARDMERVRHREADKSRFNDPMSPEADTAFDAAVRKVSPAVLDQFQVHGIAAGPGDRSPSHLLMALLSGGIDPKRPFHSGPAVPGGHGVDTTRTHAPYLLLSDPGQSVRDSGVKTVVLNDSTQLLAGNLARQFPRVRFLTAAEAPAWMEHATRGRVGLSLAERPRRRRRPVRLSLHAPVGGITIAGKEFTGGEFIPGRVLAKASAAQRQDILRATAERLGNATKEKAKRGELKEARRADAEITTPKGKVKKQPRLVFTDGSQVPVDVPAGKVPAAWKNVRVTTDPEADVWVTAVDEKGRTKTVYSDSYELRQAAIKFARNYNLVKESPKVAAQIAAARTSDDPTTREAAACMWLVQEQATRPGSDKDTKAKVKAFGATTLRGEHVVAAEDGVRLQFVGKEGVYHDHLVRNPDLATELLRRKAAAGEGGKLFDTTDAKLLAFAKQLDSGRFTPKDFRTLKATTLATEAVKSMPVPATEKERRAAMMAVASKVSHVLGNKPAQALESYINPMVWSAWSAAS